MAHARFTAVGQGGVQLRGGFRKVDTLEHGKIHSVTRRRPD